MVIKIYIKLRPRFQGVFSNWQDAEVSTGYIPTHRKADKPGRGYILQEININILETTR